MTKNLNNMGVTKGIIKWGDYITPSNNNGRCPKCGSMNIGGDNLNWWCNDC